MNYACPFCGNQVTEMVMLSIDCDPECPTCKLHVYSEFVPVINSIKEIENGS